MTKDGKYYIPDLSEFHIGFKYEMKANFGDGTVKTKQQFDAADWQKETVITLNSFPYIERTLFGKNSINGLQGIRVKFLDIEDWVIAGWVSDADNSDTNKINFYTHSDRFYANQDTEDNRVEIGDEQNEFSFAGYIKNVSELRKLQKQLGIK